MKKLLLSFCTAALINAAGAQNIPAALKNDFTVEMINPATPVKSQDASGTCWAFSTTSLVESQALRNHIEHIDLSEMFTVRNIYIEKARNYLMRQGAAQFGEGGLGHNVIEAIAKYGAVPEEAYSGLINGRQTHNHAALVKELKNYLDSILKARPLVPSWQTDVEAILDKYLGQAPQDFTYNGVAYTPKSFAKEALKFTAADYVNLTSFTHKPFYQPFILDIPDNFSNGSYYNLPLEELIGATKNAVENGYTVMWDADVSNNGFRQKNGLALYIDPAVKRTDSISFSMPELKWDAATRQRLFENLTTEDDHLMHLIGLAKSKDGREFFTVKNSWGQAGPYKGLIEVSEAYFAINTVSLVVPKAALSAALLKKLKID